MSLTRSTLILAAVKPGFQELIMPCHRLILPTLHYVLHTCYVCMLDNWHIGLHLLKLLGQGYLILMQIYPFSYLHSFQNHKPQMDLYIQFGTIADKNIHLFQHHTFWIIHYHIPPLISPLKAKRHLPGNEYLLYCRNVLKITC
jgi:hypothetical protein